ncbi:hypothetical protein [Actinomadura sp. SCN-SB]
MACPPAIHHWHGIAENSEGTRAGVAGFQRPHGATIDLIGSLFLSI